MKTILFSLATTETAGPSAEVSVPTRNSTLSLRMSSRAWRTASLASALESRTLSSSLRPAPPPPASLPPPHNLAAPAARGVAPPPGRRRALGRRIAEQGRRARERHGHAHLDRLLRLGHRRDQQRQREGESQDRARVHGTPPCRVRLRRPAGLESSGAAGRATSRR